LSSIDRSIHTLHVTTREAWRAWLTKHHITEREIWLLYAKKHTGKPRVPYDDAVEEAICFGWIDSLVRRIDDDYYAQKFTPRKPASAWSDLNIWRARKLRKEGRMTETGLALTGKWIHDEPGLRPRAKKKEAEIPAYIEEALQAHPAAWENFSKLAPSHRRSYVGWITSAKREETRERRIREAVERLTRNEPLGMK